jgi:hypothetical protein
MDHKTLMIAYQTVSGIVDTKRTEAQQYPIGSHEWNKYFDQAEALSNAAVQILEIKTND